MKTNIGGWAQALSKKYGISWDMAKNIITSYTKHSIEKLCNGERVVLVGLASITPKEETSLYFATPAYDCMLISKEYGITPATAWGIVSGFMEMAREAILRGEDVTIRGLCTLKLAREYETQRIFNVHIDISRTLVDKLKSHGVVARAKVNVKLRHDLLNIYQEKAV